MRSIIEEIANAETQSENIRQQAAAEARDLLQSTRTAIQEEQAALEQRERDLTRARLVEAEASAGALADEMLQKLGSEADEQCAAARARLDEAAAYLLGKAQEIA